MNVRQFGIKNAESADNEMYDLMDLNHMFMSPEGLGFGTEVDTMRIGQTFIVTDEKPEQSNPSGDMWFSTYEEYDRFAKFVNVGGCVLCYKPSDSIPWRYLEVYVNMEKSEIDHETGYLVCPTTFKGTSRWYEAMNLSDTEGELSEDAKMYKDQTEIESAEHEQEGRYYYIYAYDSNGTDLTTTDPTSVMYGHSEEEGMYYYRYSTEYSGTISFDNGSSGSYFRLTIYGPCLNPRWLLYKNGEIIKTGKVFAEITDTQKFVVDTHPATMEISRYSNQGALLEDLYGSSDFTTERIFEIPRGDSYMTIMGEDNAPRAWIEVKKIVSP